jgi:flagellar biosynthesis/type III secretory pathway protein FliH
MCAIRLEVFEVAPTHRDASVASLEQNAAEEAKLASYEQGYSAGWEDAAAAQSDDQSRLKSDIARNLQGLGFTFQEARAHVLRAIEPVISGIVGQLLPELAREALGPAVLEALLPLIETQGDAPVTVVVSPASRAAVEPFLAQNSGLPMAMVEEPTLGEGQVYLRLGNVEAHVDLDSAVVAITEAVRGFYTLLKEERKYG